MYGVTRALFWSPVCCSSRTGESKKAKNVRVSFSFFFFARAEQHLLSINLDLVRSTHNVCRQLCCSLAYLLMHAHRLASRSCDSHIHLGLFFVALALGSLERVSRSPGPVRRITCSPPRSARRNIRRLIHLSFSDCRTFAALISRLAASGRERGGAEKHGSELIHIREENINSRKDEERVHARVHALCAAHVFIPHFSGFHIPDDFHPNEHKIN